MRTARESLANMMMMMMIMVVMVMVMVMMFWVVTPCSLVVGYQRFGDTRCLHIQG
jgi:hypothetical protein